MLTLPTNYYDASKKRRGHANRGMNLENLINQANERYRSLRRAAVHKAPTPVKITEITPKGRVMGLLDRKAFVDYFGVADGFSVAFDAKETKESYFPLRNVEAHQLQHLADWEFQGGHAFLVVHFAKYKATYIITYEQFDSWVKSNERKSIPHEFFEQNCSKVEPGMNVTLDWLTAFKRIHWDAQGDV